MRLNSAPPFVYSTKEQNIQYHCLKTTRLLVAILVANWVLQSSSGAVAWASGLTNVAAATIPTAFSIKAHCAWPTATWRLAAITSCLEDLQCRHGRGGALQ